MKKSSPLFLRLAKLMTPDHFYDGTRLGDQLGITRSAVWKMMKKLDQLGIPMESVKGKGYALKEPLQLLDENYIQQQLHADNIKVDVYESVTSTNVCFESVANPGILQVALAEQQTQGRGRLRRHWVSPFAKNLYCSCLISLNKDMSELAGLSLVVSLAMVNAIESVTGLNGALSVKWPNDVYYQQQKLAGTLIEIHAEPHGYCRVIIGMGINVNMLANAKEAKDIARDWTSLRQITGQYVDRNPLALALIQQMHDYLRRFEHHGLSKFIDEWNALDCLRGHSITLHGIAESVSGQVQGISQQGHLQLKCADGSLQYFAAGDVSTQPKLET